MLIRVLYKSNDYDMVNPSVLESLIKSGRVKMFFRAEGWAVVGRDPIRERDEPYSGPDRRESVGFRAM